MTESVDLKNLERRPQQYWDVDGLPELVMGLLWIVWGGAWLFGQTLPRGSVWNTYWLFTPALLACSGVAAVWAIKRLKARITFPRAGFVEWKEPTRGQRLATAGVAILAAAALAGLLAASRQPDRVGAVAAPGVGVLLSLGFLVASLKQRAPHLLALAGVALMLGLAFGALRTGWDAMNWMLVALGAASMIVGAVRLRLFIRANPLERHA